MFCPNCGTKNGEGVNFCQNCGNKLEKVEQVQLQQDNVQSGVIQQSNNQENTMQQDNLASTKIKEYKKWLKIENIINLVSLICATVLILFAFILLFTSDTFSSLFAYNMESFIAVGFAFIIFILVAFLILLIFMLTGLKKQKQYPGILGIIYSSIMFIGYASEIFSGSLFNDSFLVVIISLILFASVIGMFVHSILYLKAYNKNS